MDTKDIFSILPQSICEVISSIKDISSLQEVRIKVNKPLIIQIGQREIVSNYVTDREDVDKIVQRMSNYSIYAFDEEIKQGYITIKGGHRIGICGNCVIENNMVKTIKNISSLNIRICREVIGCSDKVMPYILNKNHILNTIVISPPKCGKTTLLRDMTRNISNGMQKYNFTGEKTCVVDERGEIGACSSGVPQMNVGLRTDILDNCPKYQGIMMAVRSMSPDVVVCDEIGTYDDMKSILMALNCGISLVTSIHGNGVEDLYRRAVFKELIENNVFERAVILSDLKGVGTVEDIYDFSKKSSLWRRKL